MAEDLFGNSDTAKRITAITPRGSDPNFRNIRVGRSVVAVLPASDVEALGLQVGGVWTAAIARAVNFAQSLSEARRIAMQLLSRRPLTTRELIDRLKKRDVTKATLDVLLPELNRDGWLDDAAMARSLATELISGKRRLADVAVLDKLRKRGFTTETAKAAVAEARSTIDPQDSAFDLAAAALKSLRGKDSTTQRRRIAARLARRGYNEDEVEAALEAIGLGPVDEVEW